MNKTNKYPVIERAVRWLLVMLLAEFVLGTLLTTVIAYDPTSPNAVQTGFLVAHILIGVGLLFGSFAHILTSRSAHLLGPKPIIGFLCIIGAFAFGSAAARDGSDIAVLAMTLLFGAAIVTYGLSYVAVKTANTGN
jgi:hypothetical protein